MQKPHKSESVNNFLPAGRKEMLARGWERPDIVLVTGDAYVDHPSFGISLIGRWLESHGYRVAILAQPRHHDHQDFMKFGAPRLFFGITAGNLDSIVANYTGNARVRDDDSYSPGGNPYFAEKKQKSERRRPDRATIRYASLARAAYPEAPIVLGGLEASLRRFIHYDYQQARLRASVLTDAKADLLVFGMGEEAILSIARRLDKKEPLSGIPGTCERLTEKEFRLRADLAPPQPLPSWQEISDTPAAFMAAELAVDEHARSLSTTPLYQKQQAMYLWQNRPAAPLAQNELDHLYSLPFQGAPHPDTPDIPAWRMVRHSVTIVRGCSGNCSFCAITRHQGPLVTSRSVNSITSEVKKLSALPHFRGTISDLGGPTANLFATSCRIKNCKKHDCFFPELCKNLEVNEEIFLEMLDECEKIAGVKHLFVSSGLRMELLLKTGKLLKRLLQKHLPGSMKIAPEHTEDNVLRLMHKPGGHLLPDFIERCRQLVGKGKLQFIPYFISSHPGCSEKDMERLGERIKKIGLEVRQFQDFTPTPGTISTAMYVTGLDRDSGKKIQVAKGTTARKKQRQILEGITHRKRKAPDPGRKKTGKKSGRRK
ncbi:MAG: YgiQ family radical SAM protein [Thermodesulfobacteriota bacterium]